MHAQALVCVERLPMCMLPEPTGQLILAPRHVGCIQMLEADACTHPPPGAPDSVKKRKPIKPIEPETLAAAAELIRTEKVLSQLRSNTFLRMRSSSFLDTSRV